MSTITAAVPIDYEALCLVACPDCYQGYGEDHGIVFFCGTCDGSGRVLYPVALLRFKSVEAVA